MGRTHPTRCEHGEVIDWGDFGPQDGPEPTCPECEQRRRTVADDIREAMDEVEALMSVAWPRLTEVEYMAGQRILDLLRPHAGDFGSKQSQP